MIDNHILPQIPDYVLGLLPAAEKQAVERHTASCLACRHALQQENRVGQQVRATVQRVTQPTNGRLAHLMPAVPARRNLPARHLTWQAAWQVALAVVVLCLVVGGVQFRLRTPVWQPPLPSQVAITATSTHTATATLSQVDIPVRQEPVQTAVPVFYISPEWQITATPAATPIAAVFLLSSN